MSHTVHSIHASPRDEIESINEAEGIRLQPHAGAGRADSAARGSSQTGRFGVESRFAEWKPRPANCHLVRAGRAGSSERARAQQCSAP